MFLNFFSYISIYLLQCLIIENSLLVSIDHFLFFTFFLYDYFVSSILFDCLLIDVKQRAIKETANVTKQIEEFIDEKCRSLNKSGTSRGGALHLAQWMKCQLEKQVICLSSKIFIPLNKYRQYKSLNNNDE